MVHFIWLTINSNCKVNELHNTPLFWRTIQLHIWQNYVFLFDWDTLSDRYFIKSDFCQGFGFVGYNCKVFFCLCFAFYCLSLFLSCPLWFPSISSVLLSAFHCASLSESLLASLSLHPARTPFIMFFSPLCLLVHLFYVAFKYCLLPAKWLFSSFHLCQSNL